MTATYPNPTDPFALAINDLLGLGMDLLGRIRAAIAHKTTDYLPRNLARNPHTAEARVTRAMDWFIALTRTLAGDRFFLPTQAGRKTAPSPSPSRAAPEWGAQAAACQPPTHNPPSPPQATPRRPRTQEDRDLDQLRRIRKAFATQTIAHIARRIYGAMGIRPGSDSWHPNLLAQGETPLEWNTRHRAAEAAFNAQQNLSPTGEALEWQTQAAETPAGPHPPDFHPRQ